MFIGMIIKYSEFSILQWARVNQKPLLKTINPFVSFTKHIVLFLWNYCKEFITIPQHLNIKIYNVIKKT